jgi:ubiquitin C-terminal hydrolase
MAPRSLDNHGNTCYFNSALQCLLRVPQISNALISGGTHECVSEFTVEYQKMVKEGDLVVPNTLLNLLNIFRKRFPSFANSRPHDAQEAFVCMLDLLDQSLVDLAFNGTKIQETVCRSGKKAHTEKFTVDMIHGDCTTVQTSQKWSTVRDYVDDSGHTWNIAATRQRYGTPHPNILALTFTSLPVTLTEELENYTLIATCTHFGNARGGHFVSLIKDSDEEGTTWLMMNDAQCIKMENFPARGRHYLALYMLKNSQG